MPLTSTRAPGGAESIDSSPRTRVSTGGGSFDGGIDPWLTGAGASTFAGAASDFAGVTCPEESGEATGVSVVAAGTAGASVSAALESGAYMRAIEYAATNVNARMIGIV